jgi:hypothetical protein
MFGLTPIFLIGLPLSIYYLKFYKEKKYYFINLFFIFSISTYLLCELTTGFSGFYRHNIFAGPIYCISLSGLYLILGEKIRKWMLISIIIVGVLNIVIVIPTSIRTPMVTLEGFSNKLSIVKYLNDNLEKNARIANHIEDIDYFLRPDLVRLPSTFSTMVANNWKFEENLIISKNMQYYILDREEIRSYNIFYTKVLDFLNRYSENKKAISVQNTFDRFIERTNQQEEFLKKHGTLLTKIQNDIEIYKLIY